MELRIEPEEVEAILLEWVEKSWPGIFNKVHIPSRYSSDQEIVFSKEVPEKEDE